MDRSQQFETEDVGEVETLNPNSREPLNLSNQTRGDQWEGYTTKSYFKSFSTPGRELPTTSDNKLQRPYSGSEASFSSRSSSTASGEQKHDSYSKNEKTPADSISSKAEKNWPLDLSPSRHYYEEEEEEENIWSNRYKMNDHPFTTDMSDRSAERRFQYIYCSHKGSYKRFNSMPSSVAQLQENASNYHGYTVRPSEAITVSPARKIPSSQNPLCQTPPRRQVSFDRQSSSSSFNEYAASHYSPIDEEERKRERRRRNNESARRSRMSKKGRQIETETRCAELEAENLTLKNEIRSLRFELMTLKSVDQDAS